MDILFGYHENILLALLIDSRRHIRDLSLRRIIAARSKPDKSVWSFDAYALKFKAAKYIDLIKLE